jgi:hypothetical protein
MTIRELIDALTEIEREHGPDVPVCHHDDWDYFVVETVAYADADDEGHEPAHVWIEGDTVRACELPGGSGLKGAK